MYAPVNADSQAISCLFHHVGFDGCIAPLDINTEACYYEASIKTPVVCVCARVSADNVQSSMADLRYLMLSSQIRQWMLKCALQHCRRRLSLWHLYPAGVCHMPFSFIVFLIFPNGQSIDTAAPEGPRFWPNPTAERVRDWSAPKSAKLDPKWALADHSSQ